MPFYKNKEQISGYMTIYFFKNLFESRGLWDLRDLTYISLDSVKKLRRFLEHLRFHLYNYIFFKKTN